MITKGNHHERFRLMSWNVLEGSMNVLTTRSTGERVSESWVPVGALDASGIAMAPGL
jgi:hypothetical protein